MPTIDVTPPEQPRSLKEPLDLKALGRLVAQHYELPAGKYDLLVEFRIGFGAFGPDANSRLPGAAVSLARVGIVNSAADGPGTFEYQPTASA